MPAQDAFAKLKRTYEMPSNKLEAITPDDNNDLVNVTRGIYIGAIGDLRVIDEFGNDVTFVGLLPGIILPIRVVRVMATGTTTANLIGLVQMYLGIFLNIYTFYLTNTASGVVGLPPAGGGPFSSQFDASFFTQE